MLTCLTLPRLITWRRRRADDAPSPTSHLPAARLAPRKIRRYISLDDARNRLHGDIVHAQPIDDLDLIRREIIPRRVRKGRARVRRARGYGQISVYAVRGLPAERLEDGRALSRPDRV